MSWPEIMRYERVRKIHGMSDAETNRYIADIALVAEDIESPASVTPLVIVDPDDDAVVATAITGKADVLCTLDRHLFHPDVMEHCRQRGVDVLTDVELLARLRK